MSVLDDLYSQQSAYARQKRQCESDRAAVRAKIRRLEEAKKAVANVKNNQAAPARDYIKNKAEAHQDTWAGNLYKDILEIHQNEINVRYENYYQDVDFILDAICDEITLLENENRNLGTLFNSIVNALNNIANEIEKWLN